MQSLLMNSEQCFCQLVDSIIRLLVDHVMFLHIHQHSPQLNAVAVRAAEHTA